MSMLTKKIYDTALQVTRESGYLLEDSKIKSEARMKLHLLDTWHRTMSRAIHTANTAYEKCIFRSYYNSFTNRHTQELTLDECVLFISALCNNMSKVKDGDWNV